MGWLVRAHAAMVVLALVSATGCGEGVGEGATTTDRGEGSATSGPGSSGEDSRVHCSPGDPQPEGCEVVSVRMAPRGECPGEVWAGPGILPGTGVCLPGIAEVLEDGGYGVTEAVPAVPDWSCPEGWRSASLATDADGNELPSAPEMGRHCEPPTPPGTCPQGFTARVGSGRCARVGLPCPEAPERFPPLERILERAGVTGEVQVIHVDPNVLAGGNGSRQRPVRSARDAWQLQRTEGVTPIVVLAGGTHLLPQFAQGRVVMGVCAAETVVVPETLSWDYAFSGEGTTVTDLTLRSGVGGIWYVLQRRAALRGVVIEDVRGGGLVVQRAGTELVLEDVVIRGVRVEDAELPHHGVGLTVSEGARVEARGLTLEGTERAAIQVGSGAVVEVEDLLIRDVGLAGQEGRTHGVFASGVGSRLELRRALVDVDVGPAVWGTREASMELTDVALSSRSGGHALFAMEAGPLHLERVLIDGRWSNGLTVARSGASVLRDVALRQTSTAESVVGITGVWIVQSEPVLATNLTVHGVPGNGLELDAGDLRLRNAVLSGGRGSASAAFNSAVLLHEGSYLVAEGLWVTGHEGVGLRVREGAEADLDRSGFQRMSSQRWSDSHPFGVVVLGEFRGSDLVFEDNAGVDFSVAGGGSAVLDDVVVRDSQDREHPKTIYRGLYAHVDGRLVARRVLVDGLDSTVLTVFEGGEASVDDLVVLVGEGSAELAAALGDEPTSVVSVLSGGVLTGERVYLRSAFGRGLVLESHGAQAALEAAVVAGHGRESCAADVDGPCSRDGVEVRDESSLTLRTAAMIDHPGTGLRLERGAEATLRYLGFAGNAVAVEVPGGGPPLDVEEHLFVDNVEDVVEVP